jgi:ABC-type nickel/cobalt efflux system permease component RcnA
VDRFYRFIGRYWLDTSALVLSTLVLAGGAYLAWTKDKVWLNRAGSLIIIIGVAVAATRFHEWLQSKANDFIEENYNSIFNDTAESIEKEGGITLSEQDRDRLHSKLKTHVQQHLAAVVEQDKRRVSLYEIYLVIAGTFINGFGDYAIAMIKTSLP